MQRGMLMSGILDVLSIIIISGNAAVGLIIIKRVLIDSFLGKNDDSDSEPFQDAVDFAMAFYGILSLLSIIYLVIWVPTRL